MVSSAGLYMANVKDYCATRDQTYDHKQILYAFDYFAILVSLMICVVTFIGFCATFSGSKALMGCFDGLIVILGRMETIVFYKGKLVFTRNEFQEAADGILLRYKHWCMCYCGLDCREKIVQEVVESCNKNIICLGDIYIGIIVLQLIAITGAYFLQNDMAKKDEYHKKNAVPIKDFRTLSHR